MPKKKKFKVKLGLEARCRLSGFKGIVKCQARYLSGCNQYVLQPTVGKDNVMPMDMQIDESVIEVIGKGVLTDEQFAKFMETYEVGTVAKEAVESPGGPESALHREAR